LLKKILFLRFVGVKQIVHGWRMQSSISFFREAQHQAGLYEHTVFGPLRAITECTLLPRIEDIKIEFPLHVDDIITTWIENYWKENRLDAAPVIAIAPGSIQPHKRWPVEKFISLCQRLESSYKIIIAIFGTHNDHSIGEHIRAHLKSEVINCAGVLSIIQAGTLLKKCHLLIGNDGGAMHLGAAVGCPTVSIIPGIEYPNSIEPWGFQDFAIRHPIPCAPCYSFTVCPQGHNRCMVDIPIEKVFSQCARILDK
jgi:ADP-heptose:LPS heptosyltransferase